MLPTKKDEIQTIHSWEHKNEALFVFHYSNKGKFDEDIHIGNFKANIEALIISKDFEHLPKSTKKSKK